MKNLTVRYCTWCEMYHNEDTPHLDKDQAYEALEYDVYHANGTIYFSQEHMAENGGLKQ